MKKTKKNFTLVELLCAVALIVILAGIGFSAYSYASHRGKETATKSLITQFGAGLETLKTKHGFYPASSSYSDISITVNADTGMITKINFGTTEIDTEDADPNKQKRYQAQMKDFLAVVDGELLKKYVANGTLTDAWGGKIQYKYPGTINKIKFDIIAPGADEGFGKDATAAPGTSSADYRDTNDEWACDDIANFQ